MSRYFWDAGTPAPKMEACLITQKHEPFALVSPPQVLSFWVKRLTRNYRDPREKFYHSRPAFQGPFKVTGTDTDRSATYDFLLVIHSNCGPISSIFWGKKWYVYVVFFCYTVF